MENYKSTLVNGELGIIALESCKELGEKINYHIRAKRDEEKSYLIKTEDTRFSNGEGKVKL